MKKEMPRTWKVFSRIARRAARDMGGSFALLSCPELEETRKKKTREARRAYAHVNHEDTIPAERATDGIGMRFICVAKAMEKLPDTFIAGILWHEVGHHAAPHGDEAGADAVVAARFGVWIAYSNDALELEYVAMDEPKGFAEAKPGRDGRVTMANQRGKRRK